MHTLALLRGHYLTLKPFLSRKFWPSERPQTEFWSTEIWDDGIGPVQLTGRLLRRSPDELVVVVHGLGGNCESGYMGLALRAADRLGRSCLLLNCRGADRSGADLYHSGLGRDIGSALASDALKEFRSVDLLGYSIGGHITYSYVLGDIDPRLRRVAAVGAPLHLGIAAHEFDAPAWSAYRTYILESLKAIYTAAYQRRPRGLHPDRARRITRIVEWDDNIVAPRFGFKGSSDYYATQSVGPRLGELRVEALYVGASHDPMVSVGGVRRYLDDAPIRAVWEDRAGHLGFCEDFDLGFDAPLGLESQVLAWLAR